MALCTQCGAEIGKARRCGCGWSASAVEERWPYDRCSATDGTNRCYFPAVHYGPQAKSGTGECRLHYRSSGPSYVEAIQESQRWYDDRKAGRETPMEYSRADGSKVPGYPTQAQLDRAHSAWLAKNSPKKTREELAKWMAKPSVRSPEIEREPGQDDEEREES